MDKIVIEVKRSLGELKDRNNKDTIRVIKSVLRNVYGTEFLGLKVLDECNNNVTEYYEEKLAEEYNVRATTTFQSYPAEISLKINAISPEQAIVKALDMGLKNPCVCYDVPDEDEGEEY